MAAGNGDNMEPLPPEWEPYIARSPYAMVEVVPWILFDTMSYFTNTTVEMNFFQKGMNNRLDKGISIQSNMYVPGMLPNPQCFLIQSILIEGISTSLKHGICRLQIGSKMILNSPAWMFGLRERGFRLKPYVMIAPLMNFVFTIQWNVPCSIGPGLNEIWQNTRDITVTLLGQWARPVQ